MPSAASSRRTSIPARRRRSSSAWRRRRPNSAPSSCKAIRQAASGHRNSLPASTAASSISRRLAGTSQTHCSTFAGTIRRISKGRLTTLRAFCKCSFTTRKGSLSMFRYKSPEMRRYTRGVLLLMTGYVLILVGVNAFFRTAHLTGISAYAAAILPALPIIGVFAVIGRLLVELRDEYIRVLLVRQMLIATGFTLSVATAWGFLEAF